MAMKQVPTEVFLATAARHGLKELMVTLAYRIDHADRVRTFDYALQLPVQWPGTGSRPQPPELEEVMGIDPSCWFDDGYRLPIGPGEVDILDHCLRFRRSHEPKGRALDRVRGFVDLRRRLEVAGVGSSLVGSGLAPILRWAQITLRASLDPAFRRQADEALG